MTKDAKTVAEEIAMEHITAWQYAHDDSKAIAAPKRFFQIVQSIYQTLSLRDSEISKLSEQLRIAKEALERDVVIANGLISDYTTEALREPTKAMSRTAILEVIHAGKRARAALAKMGEK